MEEFLIFGQSRVGKVFLGLALFGWILGVRIELEVFRVLCIKEQLLEILSFGGYTEWMWDT